MENSTKALLIAASILIVIILVAISIRLLNSTNGTSDQAEIVSDALGNTSQKASDSITASLSKNNNKDTISVNIYLTQNGGLYANITAKKNMTWQEFANSNYNNIGLIINANGSPIIEIDGTNYFLRDYSDGTGTKQKENTIIQKDKFYVTKPY